MTIFVSDRYLCGGTDEVGRRRHALVHAAGEIELRLVARAEEAAEPIRTEVRGRDLRTERRRAPEVRADADRTSTLSLIERCSFLQYAGCCGTFDFGSASRASSFGSDSSIGCVRLITQHDLAAPLDVDLLAGLELADVDLDRRARRLRALARERTT